MPGCMTEALIVGILANPTTGSGTRGRDRRLRVHDRIARLFGKAGRKIEREQSNNGCPMLLVRRAA